MGTAVLSTKEADQKGFFSNKEANEMVFAANGLLVRILYTGGKLVSIT